MHCALICTARFQEVSHRAIPAIGLYYLQAYAKKYSPNLKITVHRTPDEIINSKPDVVGISSVTENFKIAIKWANQFRDKFDPVLLIGGDHISALPHTLPEIFDAGIVGEGEQTFIELLNTIEMNPDWRKKLPDIPGVCFHDDDRVTENQRRPLIEPLERIPIPHREKKFWGGFHYCFTSRGCPYNCTFCSPNVIWKKYRAFPADYVISELDTIFANFKPYYVHFFDDLFIGDRERVKVLSKLVQGRGYNKKSVFGGHIRADLIDSTLCRDLKAMNFDSGAFGAESGSDKILKFLKAGTTTVEMNQQAIDLCSRHGISLNLSFIIGTPGETTEDLDKTIEFIKRNRKKMSGIEIFIAMPYPGTPLWRLCKRKGQVSDDMDWDVFRSTAFFSEMTLKDDFFFINENMVKPVFREYVERFKQIDREFNKNNFEIFNFIEEGVPSPVNPVNVEKTGSVS